MGILANEDRSIPAIHNNHEELFHNMGALAPQPAEVTDALQLARKEQYRPIDAGRVALRPDQEILTAIKLYCLKNGQTLTAWFEQKALETIYADREESGRQGAKAPQIRDDLRVREKSVSSIARIYLFWNAAFNRKVDPERVEWKPNWTNRDETQSLKIAHVNINIVEIAIIRTACTKSLESGRINSFRYYVPQILADHQEAGSLSTKSIDRMLASFREKAAIYFKVTPPTF